MNINLMVRVEEKLALFSPPDTGFLSHPPLSTSRACPTGVRIKQFILMNKNYRVFLNPHRAVEYREQIL
jgi:hypothetical protein